MWTEKNILIKTLDMHKNYPPPPKKKNKKKNMYTYFPATTLGKNIISVCRKSLEVYVGKSAGALIYI